MVSAISVDVLDNPPALKKISPYSEHNLPYDLDQHPKWFKEMTTKTPPMKPLKMKTKSQRKKRAKGSILFFKIVVTHRQGLKKVTNMQCCD